MPGGRAVAGWGARASAFLIDYFGIYIVAVFVYYAISTGLGGLLFLVALGVVGFAVNRRQASAGPAPDAFGAAVVDSGKATSAMR